jgi:hypothetical protein
LLGLLNEQIEDIKVDKLLKYSPHVVIVHDSLLDEKLFKKTQSGPPRSMDNWKYLSVGKIHSLWSKKRKDCCFKFKLKAQKALSASRIRIPLALQILYILTK